MDIQSRHYYIAEKEFFLFVVCNYISYKNLLKPSLPYPFARKKAKDGTLVCDLLCWCNPPASWKFVTSVTTRHILCVVNKYLDFESYDCRVSGWLTSNRVEFI